MAACGSLEHIFEKPLPDNPTLLQSLSSWKQIKSIRPVDESSVTEIFGELHFKENPIHPPVELSSSSSVSSYFSPNSTFDVNTPPSGIETLKRDVNGNSGTNHEINRYYHPPSQRKQYSHSDSFSSMNSERLSLCTEGLGFESSGDVDDLFASDFCNDREERRSRNHFSSESKRSRTSRGEFPPPISCIGRSGKPWVCFKSYREDGRFILKEIRIPTQEFLHACREDGRLKLRFIHSESDDDIFEEDEEDEESVEENVEDDDDKRERNGIAEEKVEITSNGCS